MHLSPITVLLVLYNETHRERELSEQIRNASDVAALGKVVDLDSFINYGVGAMLASDWDGTSNNHYLYRDPATSACASAFLGPPVCQMRLLATPTTTISTATPPQVHLCCTPVA